ncbi:peptidase C15, pyroglutamyl peptidase I-like protein [Lophium mytilinum]|uniref:Peptidase C15, pyroglutamyl peptidase I-like protein n=1 Tax=Lophium mytilinum TaxID=390894 RepID=A0A6A6RDP4_9PEZI|nr:peptidase C15, pyroglutamyl peptidase I-like protein [Lophium mytilinum]
MPPTTSSDEVKVMVTGATKNPSWEICKLLPSNIASRIRLLVHPEALKVSYATILPIVPKLLAEYNPDIVVHIGLAVGQPYYSLEKSAPKSGYHQNPDVTRRVFTKAETKKAWGKLPETLSSTIDLDAVGPKWIAGVKIGKFGADVRVTDDVGEFTCGFVYFATLAEMSKKAGERPVVFLHVPEMESETEFQTGAGVVVECIKTLVEVWEEVRGS